MRDNPIHGFFQLLTGQIGDQLALASPLRWFTIVIYWLLLLGAFAVATHNWRRDPAQRTTYHVGLFLTRLVLAGMWYLGSFWKLPLPVAGGFKFWMESTVKFSSFQWHADIMQVFLDHIAIVGPLVYLLEVSFAASLMLGIAVRLSGVVAALFTLNLLIGLYNDPTEWPWTYVGIIVAHALLATNRAGLSLGVDNLLTRRLAPYATGPHVTARALRWAFSAA